MLQDLQIGAEVRDSGGAKLGTLTRVVVDGTSERVLGLVVDPGLVASGNLLAPGGWERPRERVVPRELVASARRDGIHLTSARADFDQLPLFEQDQFVNVDPLPDTSTPAEHRRFHLGDLINYAASEFGLGGAPYLPPAVITHNEPPTAGAIDEGTPVWRLEPRERIGEVQRVLLDEASGRLSALVVRRSGRSVLLSAEHIASIQDGLIEVNLTVEQASSLPLYEPND